MFSGVVLSVIIHYNTIAHPYLLADNRHFTFYIWRRFFMRHWGLKFVLVPVYIMAAYCIASTIQKSELMFRYYIIPFILVRLQIKPSSFSKLAIEFLVLVAINTITLYLFLFKPFTWEHEPQQLQRFMW